MSLTSFNSFLLQKFAKNLRLGPDVRSLLRRHQTLSIIYANFVIILMVGLFEIASIHFGLSYHYIMVIISPFVALSFLSLKLGKNDLAAVSVLMYLHIGNGYASHFLTASLTALTTIFMFPTFSFFMSSSTKVQIFNMVLCIVQSCGHVINFRRVFALTATEDQTKEINQLTAVTFGCLGFMCFLSVLQKTVETNIWQLAQLDHEKAENITKEVMQAVEAKETFISSLSHEIRNPLNAISGSISYLLEIVKDTQQRQILNTAKLSGETLLNLINNLLDTAKLKSEKMELVHIETNVRQVFEKVLAINSETLRKKNLFIDVYLNKKIPQLIWSDSSRILQIIMNLVSNSIKFTPHNGKMAIYATWCSTDQTPEALLTPVPRFRANKTKEPLSCGDLDLFQVQDKRFSNNLSVIRNDSAFALQEFSLEEATIRSRNLSFRSFETQGLEQVRHRQSLSTVNSEPWKIHRVDYNEETQESTEELEFNQASPSTAGERAQRGYLKIQISDTGCGIEPENIPRLFRMFTQAQRDMTTSYGGTGLGLWISKQLCNKMGGDIKAWSQAGRGSEFVFYVSVDNCMLHRAPSLYNARGGSIVPDKVAAFIVDDFAYNRDLHKLLLEREGARVITACDGEEAVKKYMVDHGIFDFIMMDVQMPIMDGFSAAKKIRELEEENDWKRVDIYFVSGEYYNEEEVMSSFKSKYRDSTALGIRCLKKPIDVDTFKKIVEKYAKRK